MTTPPDPLVRMRGIVKRFPGVLANAGVDFDLLPGEVHALLGENGAGKSTLMNVLYGLHVADEGEIFLRSKRVAFHSAADAIDAGLGMVHQHFMLVKPFTVAENIVLGRASPRAPFLEDRRAVAQRLIALSQQYGLQIDPSAPVWTLSVGEQQRVEILKALYRGADVLVLDEPTAVLTPQEWTGLLAIIRRLQAEGKSIVFISHKLGEVLAVADRITVMRDGRVVGETRAHGTDKNTLARMMVGRDVMLVVRKGPASPGAPVLTVTEARADNDRGLPALQGVSLEVRAGEILGIAGVAGNGQTELEEVIAGLRPLTGGSISVCGRPLPARARGGTVPGLAHVPSDRYGMAMLKDFSIAENLVLQNVGEPPFTSRGFLDRGAIRSNARNLVADFDVRTPSIETMAGNLSGGNAQKMVLARELSRAPKVLLAAQPTRGLDVAAIEFVHNQLVEQRDAGVGVLLISTELDEILALSDRIAVMYEGQIVGIVDPNEIDVKDIGLMMAGQRSAPPGDAARGV